MSMTPPKSQTATGAASNLMLKATVRTIDYKMTHYDDRAGRPKRSDLQSMPFEVLAERVTVSKNPLSKANPVHWLTMKPRQATAAEAT